MDTITIMTKFLASLNTVLQQDIILLKCMLFTYRLSSVVSFNLNFQTLLIVEEGVYGSPKLMVRQYTDHPITNVVNSKHFLKMVHYNYRDML